MRMTHKQLASLPKYLTLLEKMIASTIGLLFPACLGLQQMSYVRIH